MKPITEVAIVGGTHGNELTGVHLVKHWQTSPEEITRPGLKTELLLANPKAIACNRRYLDQDLNRQFAQASLENMRLGDYEQSRAKVINNLLGPKHDPRVDFIFDLHTTTANMGTTLVINSDDPLIVGMAFYIKQHMPHATLFYNKCDDRLNDNFLASVAKYPGLLIEVGPVPQGVLNHHIIEETRQALGCGLDYLQQLLEGKKPSFPASYSAFEFIEKVRLPENDDGEIIGMVHRDLQNKDYQPLQKGAPLFACFDGSIIRYEGDEGLSAAFINEAAYYDQHIGLSLMRPITLTYKN